MKHPCMNCGACCAIYRVSFHWSETLPESFHVPDEYAIQLTPHRLALKFKNSFDQTCSALQGRVGKDVQCSIYSNRPSPCRNFVASYENGKPDSRCDDARRFHGLRPLTLDDWRDLVDQSECSSK